jgi:1,4-alpha-glucan branching enzyme
MSDEKNSKGLGATPHAGGVAFRVWAPNAQRVAVIGFPSAGTWKLRFNSDWQGYSNDFAGHPSTNVVTEPGAYDGFPCHAALSIGPYSVLIFSQ